MVLQLEDCIDCLKLLYPHYDYLFLFDHSCGHDRQREDGLSIEKMSKSYGGTQKRLRDTKIKQQVGYLGPYSPSLNVGDVQSMWFKPGDIGPFWMSATEWEEKQHDKVIGGATITRQFTKTELIAKLKEKGITAKGKKDAIVAVATENNVPLSETKDKIIEGWEGKPIPIKIQVTRCEWGRV